MVKDSETGAVESESDKIRAIYPCGGATDWPTFLHLPSFPGRSTVSSLFFLSSYCICTNSYAITSKVFISDHGPNTNQDP